MLRSLVSHLSIAFAVLATVFTPLLADAAVPVRISLKFILDMNDNRPATGDVNSDNDVEAQVSRANEILAAVGSEHRVELIEIVDLDDAASFYSSSIGGATRDSLREAAIADPTRYGWRSDAVNFYVNGATGSAIADFPSDNNIVLAGQGIFDTTFLHELGHILDLFHTHETNGGGDGDSCGDTISDMANWSWADIAENNFGSRMRNQLTNAEAAQVDAVWDNVMSYHDGNNRSFLTKCQMDRQSDQGWDDRSWMLTRQPLYVNPSTGTGGNSGSWGNPFATIEEAIGAGQLTGRTLVLMAGQHTMTSNLDSADLDVVARRGSATIRRDIEPWAGRVDPSQSPNPAVAEAMQAVQTADRAGDTQGAMEALLRGEAAASGADLIAIQLELGQRYRHVEALDAALPRYEAVAETAARIDDETLRSHALHYVERIRSRQEAERTVPGEDARPDANDEPGAIWPLGDDDDGMLAKATSARGKVERPDPSGSTELSTDRRSRSPLERIEATMSERAESGHTSRSQPASDRIAVATAPAEATLPLIRAPRTTRWVAAGSVGAVIGLGWVLWTRRHRRR